MSGGSYEYLYTKDAEDLIHNEHLDNMIDRVAALGYADDFARELERLDRLRRQYRLRADEAIRDLSGVMRAIEWWDSGDTSEVEFKQALAEWMQANAEKKNKQVTDD